MQAQGAQIANQRPQNIEQSPAHRFRLQVRAKWGGGVIKCRYRGRDATGGPHPCNGGRLHESMLDSASTTCLFWGGLLPSDGARLHESHLCCLPPFRIPSLGPSITHPCILASSHPCVLVADCRSLSSLAPVSGAVIITTTHSSTSGAFAFCNRYRFVFKLCRLHPSHNRHHAGSPPPALFGCLSPHFLLELKGLAIVAAGAICSPSGCPTETWRWLASRPSPLRKVMHTTARLREPLLVGTDSIRQYDSIRTMHSLGGHNSKICPLTQTLEQYLSPHDVSTCRSQNVTSLH